jgi:hypothetical protein
MIKIEREQTIWIPLAGVGNADPRAYSRKRIEEMLLTRGQGDRLIDQAFSREFCVWGVS